MKIPAPGKCELLGRRGQQTQVGAGNTGGDPDDGSWAGDVN